MPLAVGAIMRFEREGPHVLPGGRGVRDDAGLRSAARSRVGRRARRSARSIACMRPRRRRRRARSSTSRRRSAGSLPQPRAGARRASGRCIASQAGARRRGAGRLEAHHHPDPARRRPAPSPPGRWARVAWIRRASRATAAGAWFTCTSRQDSGRPAISRGRDAASRTRRARSRSSPRARRGRRRAWRGRVAISSGSRAERLGIGRPSFARCLVVREVVKPSAPAAQRLLEQGAHARAISAVGRHLVVVGAALAHHVEAQRRVRHLRADVDRVRRRVERVEVFGEGLPVEARRPRPARCRGCPRRLPSG